MAVTNGAAPADGPRQDDEALGAPNFFRKDRTTKDRPRILMVDHTASLGGAELLILRLVRRIDTERFDCRVLLFSDGPLVSQLKDAGVPVDILPLSDKVVTTSRFEAGGALFRFHEISATAGHAWRVARYLRAHRIDLVHTHSLKSNLIAGLASRLARRPCVWHLHVGITDDYMPPRLARVFRFLTRTVPQYLIFNSESTFRSIRSLGGKPSWIVYPGTQIEDFTPPEPARVWDSDHATVGIVGRISSTKGQDIFLRAAAQVLRQFPKTRFQVVGGALFTDLPYKKVLDDLTDALGIADSVEFTGFVSDVAAHLHAMDIFVLASTSPEPFGQSVVEAMAAGKPVIATDAGGVPEIVQHGQTGLLVPPGDVDQMAAAIRRLLSDPAGCAEMARRGRQRAAERFSIERMVRDTEAMYLEILG